MQQEYEQWKKAKMEDQEVKHLRQGLFLMRKNIIKVRVPKRKLSAHSCRAPEVEDRVEDFYQSSPKRTRQMANKLNLPTLNKQLVPQRRAISSKRCTQNDYSEQKTLQHAESSLSEIELNDERPMTSSSQQQQKTQNSFSVKVMKDYQYDRSVRELAEKVKAD